MRKIAIDRIKIFSCRNKLSQLHIELLFCLGGVVPQSSVITYAFGFGYDPFGLSKKPEDFAKYKVYELIHAKVGNAGAAGFIILEAFDDDKFGANCGPEAAWFKMVLLS
ncbi:chlorophyll a-b binding protein CP26, chloroplastic-like [Musa acuminata AAA Group]|uniref:chlorophyll a-b binding protein CP26, chloroplastic-like n=1 Tax=Musa acuminata AAA Group TaxID=214697 RepID=UPI0031DCF40A